MKKWASLSLLSIVLFGAVTTAVASTRGDFKGYPVVGVVVNGRELQPDVPAIIMDGRTLLPLRAITEALGAQVKWDGGTYTASVALPRDLTMAEYEDWEDQFDAQFVDLWWQYNALRQEVAAGRFDPLQDVGQVLALLNDATLLLRKSMAITSSDQETDLQMNASRAGGALVWSDVFLWILSSMEQEPAQIEAAAEVHRATTRLLEQKGIRPQP